MPNHNQSMLSKIPKPVQIILILVLALLAVNIISRIHSSIQLRKQTIADEEPLVSVMTTKAETGVEQIVLPGNVKAWHDATIYARTSGYIKEWYVDIGSHVKKGQLLAVIETPELDAQLRQAKADLKTAIANNKLAQITAKRWLNLLKTESVSKQEADEKTSTAAALEALVVASTANVNRLKELVSFERVIAPFDGVITARHTDIGALINQGSVNTTPLFEIEQTNPLRIYVKIPQNYAAQITSNMKVNLRFAEHPGQEFSAQLIETAQAIDPSTRTLLAQFKVNNSKELLLAGGYTEVLFSLTIPPNTILIPVNTLLFQAAGLQIAVVNSNNQVDLRTISISRDLGDNVEIRSGIKPGEQVIIYPPDAIVNGQKVRIAL
jgi:RND family efflux transporter MFP subunit